MLLILYTRGDTKKDLHRSHRVCQAGLEDRSCIAERTGIHESGNLKQARRNAGVVDLLRRRTCVCYSLIFYLHKKYSIPLEKSQGFLWKIPETACLGENFMRRFAGMLRCFPGGQDPEWEYIPSFCIDYGKGFGIFLSGMTKSGVDKTREMRYHM